jgi:hypothetical protein
LIEAKEEKMVLSNYQFETLAIPGDRWRLDLLAQASGTETNRKPFNFETEEACWAEDDRRATALDQFPSELCEGLEGCSPRRTALLLAEGLVHKWLRPCAASAAYMRNRRLAFLGSILKLLDNNPQRDLAFITLTHPAWHFNLRYNWHYPRFIANDFADFIDKIGVSSAAGFLISVLTGHYNPASRNIQLFMRAICAGNKLKQFPNMYDDGEDVPRMFGWEFHEVVNLPAQLTAMMPNRITELPEEWKGEKRFRRMRQPFHSIYLIWLARSSFAREPEQM